MVTSFNIFIGPYFDDLNIPLQVVDLYKYIDIYYFSFGDLFFSSW